MLKMKYCFVAIALISGLVGIARAQSNDFQMVVIDPINDPNPPTNYTVYGITSTDFPVTFTPCAVNQIPSSAEGTYSECFTGVNDMSDDITSLTLVVPPIDGQTTATCTPDGDASINLFTVCNATTTDENYTLDFSGAGIAPGVTFVIAEDGVLSDFPDTQATATLPESRSMSLLVADVVMSLGFIAFWRRRGFGLARV